ncbi:hypothetical protein LWI29_032598 [Acer saccharum]|uniref:Uncharacterized protein n=1 Tax=Acer saccharum TaxID=4024 RepID=A0AA39VEL8_ACESA|nr:hypothetical protein LWI29_032598 [Acer saccharum]
MIKTQKLKRKKKEKGRGREIPVAVEPLAVEHISPSLLLLLPWLLPSPDLWPSLTSGRHAPLAVEHISPSHTSGLRSFSSLLPCLLSATNNHVDWVE